MRSLPLLLLGPVLLLAAASNAADLPYARPAARSYRIEPGPGTSTAARAGPTDWKAAVHRAMSPHGVPPATLDSLGLVGETTIRGLRHLRLQQQVGGLPLYGSTAKVVVGADGLPVHVVERLAPLGRASPLEARIDERRALELALAHLYPNEHPAWGEARRDGPLQRFGAFFHMQPEVSRVVVPQQDGQLAHGFLVAIWARKTNQLDHVLVGGTGSILSVQGRTARDSYYVFPDSPEHGPQVVVQGPAPGGLESPAGWLGPGPHRSIEISGNNVHAYLDTSGTWTPDTGGTTVTDGHFLSRAELRQPPGTDANRAVVLQNLFYLVNRIHDELYRHGFTEAAGNFQADNFGRGGRGNDAVRLQGQDISNHDNASMAAPPDGIPPMLQMHLWSARGAGGLQRDGGLDSDLVFHEYGHGLTWRMIGDMSGPMAGGVGEGASDTLAFLMNGRDVMFTYAEGRPGGARRHPFGSHPLTYADVDGAHVHDDGEIYAAAMWRLRELWLASGRSHEELFDTWVDAMNYIAPRPAYEDMRNGLLDSILHGATADASARCALVWRAFAERGIGDGAQGREVGDKVVVTPSHMARHDCSRTS